MKKIALFFILFLLNTNIYAAKGNLYEMFKDYSEIKVFLRDVVNETKNQDVKTDVFKSVFEDVLKKRINIKFTPVNNENDADVIVISRIKDYAFTDKAIPVRAAPLFLIAIIIVADTAEPKSAAKLVVDYEIRRPEDSKLLFSYRKLATETRKPQREMMKRETGYISALNDNIGRFIFRAFYRQANR